MTRTTASRRFWLVNAALWAVYAGISAGMGRVFSGSWSSGITVVSLLLGVLLCLASGAIRGISLRRDWLALEAGALAARLLLAIAIAAAAVQVGVAAVLVPLVRSGAVEFTGYTGYGLGKVAGYWVNTAIVLGLWTGAWAGSRMLRRARAGELAAVRAESDRRALELDALRARLNPHFVFNALNNLRALILEDPERARELVTRLSNTLRHALEHSQRDWTTLDTELGVVRDYLAVEAVHYEERLRVEMDVAPGIGAARLPPMALQLLVENAIKHGISRTPGGGRLAISASLDDGPVLSLRVGNPGLLGTPGDGPGVGLAFLRERLRRGGGRFSLEQHGPTVVAVLEIPQ